MRPFNVGDAGHSGGPVPHVQRPVVALIVVCGVCAFALSITAEYTRTQYYQIKSNVYNELVCYYEPSTATIWASIATVALAAAQAVAVGFGGLSWSRPLFQRHMADNKAVVGRAVQRTAILFIMDILFFLAALAVLIAAAVENKYHVSEVPYGQLFMQCSVVSQGLFFSAALLSAISTVLMVTYYYYAVRANEELWLCNYIAAPVVVDMEAFSREAGRTSITAVISDKRSDGGERGGPGKLAAISHTPVSHARLA